MHCSYPYGVDDHCTETDPLPRWTGIFLGRMIRHAEPQDTATRSIKDPANCLFTAVDSTDEERLIAITRSCG